MKDAQNQGRQGAPPVVRITALDHFVLRVRELEPALEFYRDTLGLPVRFLEEYEAGQRPFVSVCIGDQLLDLVPDSTFSSAQPDRSSGFLHFCVRIAERLEDVVPRLKERGVALLEETPVLRMGAAGMGRSLYVRDPDGYVVELKEDRA